MKSSKALEYAFKDVDTERRTVSGYFASFDTVDNYGDVIRKGAFAKTIKERGPNSAQPQIFHVLNHDTSKPIGKLKELTEDNFGLFYASGVGTHTLGRDFIEMATSGLITQHSFMYKVLKSNQLADTSAGEGVAKWELLELKMFEGSSLTAWGVNNNTPLIDIKGMGIDDLVERSRKIESFARNSTATDETIKMLLTENVFLLNQIAEIKAGRPPLDSTEPRTLDFSAILSNLI